MLLEEVIELVLLRCMNCDAKTTAQHIVDAFCSRNWYVLDDMGIVLDERMDVDYVLRQTEKAKVPNAEVW
jgi:hypothetical protein